MSLGQCEDQAEVDHYWCTLSEGGVEEPCGWLKDRCGMSWQVVPTTLPALLADPDPGVPARERGDAADGKIDIEAMRKAAADAS